MVGDPARRGPRGRARRRVQPHLRGRRRRPVAVVARPGRRRLVRPRRAGPRHRPHRLRQHPRRRVAAGPEPGRRLPAPLGDDDGRRRLPLRPRLDPRTTPRRRLRPGRAAAHRHHLRPGALGGQADRRALGRHRRGLPGRRLRARRGRSGTGGSATACATSGAATDRSRRSSPAIAGSSDLYWPARTPAASVNFVTAHDGFTLADLVSYERKHNEANGEQGRDGTDDNRSANHGVEGPTSDPAILALRARQARNLLTTLLLSAGTPMLLGGDELGHTQHGNNNVYSLDDETSWRAWDSPELVDFVARALVPAPRHPGAAAHRLLLRPRGHRPRRRRPGHRLAAPRRPRVHRARLPRPRPDARGPRRRRRPRCCWCCTPATPPSTSSCPPPSATPPGPRCSTPARPAAPRPRPTPCPPASPSPSRPTRPWCCGRRRSELTSVRGAIVPLSGAFAPLNQDLARNVRRRRARNAVGSSRSSYQWVRRTTQPAAASADCRGPSTRNARRSAVVGPAVDLDDHLLRLEHHVAECTARSRAGRSRCSPTSPVMPARAQPAVQRPLRPRARTAVGESDAVRRRAPPRGVPPSSCACPAGSRGSPRPAAGRGPPRARPSSRPRIVAASSTVRARVVTATPATRVRSTGSITRRDTATSSRGRGRRSGGTAARGRPGAASCSPHHHAAEVSTSVASGPSDNRAAHGAGSRRLVVLGHLVDPRAGREPRLRRDLPGDGLRASTPPSSAWSRLTTPYWRRISRAERDELRVGAHVPFDAAARAPDPCRFPARSGSWSDRSAQRSVRSTIRICYAGSTTRPSSAGAARRSWRGSTRTV